MKRTGDYFVHIKHLVFVEHKGQTYMREENIINGKVTLRWDLKVKNEHGTWDTAEYVSDTKTLNVLNKEYDKMSYAENFK